MPVTTKALVLCLSIAVQCLQTAAGLQTVAELRIELPYFGLVKSPVVGARHVDAFDNIPKFRTAAMMPAIVANSARLLPQVEDQYRLVGMPQDWSEWIDLKDQEFRSLPPGDYTLEVRSGGSASTIDGTDSLSFRIVKPWYNTWLAWCGFTILALLLTGATVRRRTIESQKQVRELERVVADRTSDLISSTEKYRWLVEGLQENYIFFTTKQSGVITYVSPSVKNVLGFEVDEVINTTWQSLAESGNTLDDTLRNAFRRKTALVVETSVRCKDGTTCWLELTQFPLKDASDLDEARECIAKDITQIRRAKENLTAARDELERRVNERTTVLRQVNQELKQEIEKHQATSRLLNQSETQYRSIVEDQAEMVIRFDPEGNLMFANRAYRERHKLTLESMRSFNVFSVIHPDDRKAAIARVAAIRSSEPIRIPLMKTIDHDGNSDWADWCGRALYDEEGTLLGYQGAGRIITDLVETQQKLRESELHYRSIVEDQTEMILRFDAKGRITFANTACALASGMSPQEAIGRRYYTRIYKDDRKRVRQIVTSSTTDKPVRQFELQSYRRDGTLRREVWSSRALFDAAGILREYQAVGRDITELWETRRRLDEKEHQLAHLARISALGEMVAGISHEINQPLATIANFASASRMVLNQSTLPPDDVEKLRTWSERTTAQTEKINAIIQRLRRFSRPGSEYEEFHIRDAISEALQVTETRTRHIVNQIEIDCRDTIPTVTADRIQIEQVIVNMIRNACDAIQDLPFVERKLGISVTAESDEIVVAIVDSGPGVKAGLATEIFQAFVTSKADGMGIGLAISRSIVEAHGGKIRAVPEVGGGRFEFSLPIHQHGAHE